MSGSRRGLNKRSYRYGNLSRPEILSNFWFRVKTYLKFEHLPQLLWRKAAFMVVTGGRGRHAIWICERLLSFPGWHVKWHADTESLYFNCLDRSLRGELFDYLCWQNRHRLVERLWCLPALLVHWLWYIDYFRLYRDLKGSCNSPPPGIVQWHLEKGKSQVVRCNPIGAILPIHKCY